MYLPNSRSPPSGHVLVYFTYMFEIKIEFCWFLSKFGENRLMIVFFCWFCIFTNVYEILKTIMYFNRCVWNSANMFGFKIGFWWFWVEFGDLLMIFLNFGWFCSNKSGFPVPCSLQGHLFFQKKHLAMEKV